MEDNEDLADEPLDQLADVNDDKVGKQKSGSLLDESLPDRNDKAHVFKNNGKTVSAVDENEEGTRIVSEFETKFCPKVEPEMEIIDVQDAEFYDFEKDKKEESFAANQIWAIYDDLDGMPRLYARIEEVYSPGFKVLITWLEAAPDDKDVTNWTREGLPVTCGKFIQEKSDEIEELEIFSHRVNWEKGTSDASYKIYPRKGEIWAVFKNWDIRWSSDPEKHRNFHYEFVEVLSEYTEELGVMIAYLVKIKGFVSLFKTTTRNGLSSFQIPPNELLRFSHRAPSYRTTGSEHENVPAGYFELDPASLPSSIEEIPDNVNVSVKIETIGAKNVVSSGYSPKEKPYAPNKSINPDVNYVLEGGNLNGGNGFPSLNGCYKENPNEVNAGHPLELTSSCTDGLDTKEIGLDPASVPTNLEEISDSVDANLNFESIGTDINVSSRSSVEEKPHALNRSTNHDEKNTLGEDNSKLRNTDEMNTLYKGSSKIRNGSPRLSNQWYKTKPIKHNANDPLDITFSGSDQVKSCVSSFTEEIGPDFPSLPSNNLEEISDPLNGKVNFEGVDPKTNGSSNFLAVECVHKQKKRKKPDGMNTRDGRNQTNRGGSPRLLNGCHKMTQCEEHANHHVEKISTDFCTNYDIGVCIDTDSFFHQLRRGTTGKKNKLEVYPRKGEVWALYRNFTSKWSGSDLSSITEHEIVEVLEDNVDMVKVSVLRQIGDRKAVYKSKVKAGNKFIMEIPRGEMQIFSHQIPAFRPSDSRLRGCWELDLSGFSPVEESAPCGIEKAEGSKKLGKEAAAAANIKGGPGPGAADESESKFGPEAIPDSEFLEVLNSDFNDFDMDRKEESFAVGQIWALYDRLDGMPRFYARIKKVYSPGFMVKITCLEADLDDQYDIDWINEGLPVTCGKFKYSNCVKAKDLSMFSHMVNWEKGTGKGSYRIYPRKGETWALFKNWDNIKWSSDPVNLRNFQYEFVEVLSDYTEELGIHVAHLVKIKGFVSLFKPTINTAMDSSKITKNELLRFSHRVPSFRTTGREREDVPEGYFELDPASLPNNLEEISYPDDVQLNVQKIDATSNGSPKFSVEESPPMRKKRKKNRDEKKMLDRGNSRTGNCFPKLPNWCNKKKRSALNQVRRVDGFTFLRESALATYQPDANEIRADGEHSNTGIIVVHNPSEPSKLDPCEIPEAQLYNFEDDKSHEKFKPDQIWAVYCDLDGLPKYYVQIRRVELFPDFKVYVRWLKSCTPPKGVIQCLDENMPLSCGIFEKGESVTFDDTAYFSHQLTGVSAYKKNKYEIYPRKGEVWALYRNFNSEMSSSDMQTCEYDMVEVLEDQVRWTIVLVLQQVSSCLETVFMAKRKKGHFLIMAIPQFELFRFSHQVPAFHMTEEKYGNLRSCWVLDSKSIPVSFLSLK